MKSDQGARQGSPTILNSAEATTEEPAPLVLTDAESSRTAVDVLLTLKDPLCPTRRLPALIQRLMPNPLIHHEDWTRFASEDLANMSASARSWEAHRIRVAAALIPDEARLPAWLLTRLERLAV